MLSGWLIIALCGLAVLGWFWQSSMGARERANHAAQDACARIGLQFLDGTVAFARLRFARNETGRLTFKRTYVFDYTAASIDRRQGFVVMLGQRIESIGFDAEPVPRAERNHTVHQTPTYIDTEHKVLNLEEWRRLRAQTRPRPTVDAEKREHDTGQDNGW